MTDRQPILPLLVGALVALTVHLVALPAVLAVAGGGVGIGWPGLPGWTSRREPIRPAAPHARAQSPRRDSASSPDQTSARADRTARHSPASDAPGPATDVPEPAPKPAAGPDEPPSVRIGSDTGADIVTVSWIAYDDFQKLIAPKGATDQPAVQREAEPIAGAPYHAAPSAGTAGTEDLTPSVATMAGRGGGGLPVPPAPRGSPSGAAGTDPGQVEPPSGPESAGPADVLPGRPRSDDAPNALAPRPDRPGEQPDASASAAPHATTPPERTPDGMTAPPPPANSVAPMTPPHPLPPPPDAQPGIADRPAKPATGAGTDLPITPPPASASGGAKDPEPASPAVTPGDAPVTTPASPATAAPRPAVPDSPDQGLPSDGPRQTEPTSALALKSPPVPPSADMSILKPPPVPGPSRPAEAKHTGAQAPPGSTAPPAAAPAPPDGPATQPSDSTRPPPTMPAGAPGMPLPPGTPQLPLGGVPGLGGSDLTAAGPLRPTGSPRSDRESDPFSLLGHTVDVNVRAGKVEVARGVELKPAVPRISTVARYSVVPRNPAARLHFDRNGFVIRAELTRSTGYENWDGPILTSLYQWRAAGQKLAALNRPFYIDVNLIFQPGSDW